MLKARLLTALLLLPSVLGALFFLSDAYWALLILGVTLIGAHEWSVISGYSKSSAWFYVFLTLLLGLSLMPQASRPVDSTVYGMALLFWVILVPLWLRNQWRLRQLPLMAITGWVVLIPTWLALVELRKISPGLLLELMAVVWIADSAAYFAGRKFGRRKLAPAISPGKTWEGVAGAYLAVTLYGVALGTLDSTAVLFRAGLPAGVLLLWLLTALSIYGDLFESWMKRVAGVKDSGRLLPGHGGVLDRIDGLTATLPIAAFGLMLINNHIAV